MTSIFTNFWLSFLAGLFAPIGAVCVLPLYPGFLAYLANQFEETEDESEKKKNIIRAGWIVALGILSSMFLFGLIFTSLLKTSLTSATEIISPIAFTILAIISILLIFNVNFSALLPKLNQPKTNRPILKAYLYGFFFGAIVLPCNPASLVVLFAISTSTLGFLENLVNFILFGIGMSLPLIILAYISSIASRTFLSFITTHKRAINIIAGLIMLAISLYYLFFVFRVQELVT